MMKIREILIKISDSKILLCIGLMLIGIGAGATYQAQNDVVALNESLYHIATTNGILTDGTTYYFVGLYENRYNFSSGYLMNLSQCNDYFIGGK